MGGALGVAPRVQTQTSSNQKMLLTKVVRYVSGLTKMHSGSPLDPWGPRGQSGGSLGVSKSNFIKSKSFANKSCQVCFKGDKKSFGGSKYFIKSKKKSLTKVVRHVSAH